MERIARPDRWRRYVAFWGIRRLRPTNSAFRATRLLSGIMVLAGASYLSGLLALADAAAGHNTDASVRRAAEIMPGNAAYWFYLYRLLDIDGRKDEALRCLERAAALNPSDPQVWTALALAAETSGDARTAEQHLFQAMRVDATFLPRWELAQFYFRQGDTATFWRWAHEASEISDDSAWPDLFRFCWLAAASRGENENLISERVVPRRPKEHARYLAFLLDENHLAAAAPVANWLLPKATASEAKPLFRYCDRLIDTGQSVAAVRVWNGLAQRGMIEPHALAPDQGISLTNGDFRLPFFKSGFDWRPPANSEIQWWQTGQPPGVRISLSGNQPESVEVLAQLMPVLPSQTYRFESGYRTYGIAKNTGLRWQVLDAASGLDLTFESPQLSSEDWNIARVSFRTADKCRLARLSLMYRRERGTTRIEGSVWLKNATLQLEHR